MSVDNIGKFLKYHDMQVIDDNKRAYKHTRMNVKYFNNFADYNELTATDAIRYDTEKLLTVEITESELQRIADFEAEVFNNLKEHGHYRMFEHMTQLKEREKYLKNKYPAVKKAYEHYSLMLKLAESGEL
jgi:predicted subunit of tRNA(5-methylaminomethyl-2-thiouridylate) methyltransferase